MKIFKPVSKFFIFLLLILILLSCATVVSKTEYSDRNEIQKIVQDQGRSVVCIVMYDEKGKPLSIGSGFFVSRDGMIATNYHVVEKGYGAIISTLDGKTYKDVYLLSKDKDMDIALIRVNETNAPQSKLGNSDTVKQADKVISIGNPQGLQNSVSDGLISGVREFERVKIFQFTCPISPGSSGGPLYNMAGEVVGITTLMSETGQNLNFAVPINYLLSLQKSTKALSLTEQYIEERKKLLDVYREEQKSSAKYDPEDSLFEEAYELYRGADPLSKAEPAPAAPAVPAAKEYSDKSIALLEKAISINPYYHAAHFLLGKIYADRKNLEKAEIYLKKSIELKPKYLVAYLKLAQIYKDSGRYNDAIQFYRTGLKMDPTDEFGINDELLISSTCDLAEILLEKNPKEAEKIYDEIIKIRETTTYFSWLGIDNKLSHIFLKKGAVKTSYKLIKKEGYWFLSADNVEERLKIYKPYLDENNFYAWASVGKMYHATNDYEKAIAYLQKAWEIDKDQFDQYYELGDALYEKDKYIEASYFLEAGLKKEPNNYDIIFTLGNVYNFDNSFESYYKMKSNYLRAIELFKNAIQLSPKAYEPYRSLSRAFYNNDQPYDALRAINNSLKLMPNYKYLNRSKKNAFILKGDILIKMNDNAEALKSYEEAITLLDIKKDLHDYNRIAEKLVKLKEYDKAINLLKVGLEEAKSINAEYLSYWSLSSLGDIYEKKSDFNVALGYYMEAIKIYPKNYTANFNIANCYHSLEKWDEAEKWWEKTIGIVPFDSAPFLNLGLVYFSTNRIDLALSNFKKALEINPILDRAKQLIKDCERIIEKEKYPDKLKNLSLRKDNVGTSAQLLSLLEEYNIANNLYIQGIQETKPNMKQGYSEKYIESYSVSSKIYEAMGRFEDIGKKLEALRNEPVEYEDVMKYFKLAVSNRVSAIEQHSQGYYILKKDYRGEFEKGTAKIKLGDKNLVDCMEALLRLINKQKMDFGDIAIENLESDVSYYKKR